MSTKLTLSVDEYKARQHEEGVQVEHLSAVILKGKSLVELEDPVGEENDGSKKTNLNEDPEKAKETS